MFSRMLPALLAALILPAAAQASGPWYVSKSGNNANTCLDALAHYRRSMGLPATSINRSACRNFGM